MNVKLVSFVWIKVWIGLSLLLVKAGLETLSNIEKAVCKAGVHLTTE
jgi:hypothetical protein